MEHLLTLLDVTCAITVNLRINLTVSNLNEAWNLLESFDAARRRRMQVDLTPVIQRPTPGQPVPVPDAALLHDVNLLARHAIESGFRIVEPRCDSKRLYCPAERRGSFHIGPDGSLMKCHDPAIPEALVGRIGPDGIPELTQHAVAWHALPIGGHECRTCRFLCFCGGGCRLHRIRGRRNEQCQVWFEDIESLVVNRYLEATRSGGSPAA